MTARSSRPAKKLVGINRRRFVQSSVALGAPLVGLSARAQSGSLEAYASATSVKQGGTIDFHARDPRGGLFLGKSVPITFTRMGVPDKVMSSTSTRVNFRFVPSDAATNGCRWPRTHRLTVPTSWPPGVYWATIGSGSAFCTVPFVVRAATRTPGVKVMVQIPVTTPQAYNNYGGKSLYGFNSVNRVRANKVSFDRPLSDPTSLGFDPWTPVFVRWLALKGVAADFCTSIDLHTDATVLNGYRLLMLAGHDEYWSLEMRKNFDQFVSAGGNAAVLGGNALWWQVRLEAVSGVANRAMVCYKSATADPIVDKTRATTLWSQLAQPYPPNVSIGLSYSGGAAWVGTQPRPDTPFVVKRPEHWVFEGAGLAYNTPFGGAYVGYETDTAAFRQGMDGRPYTTGADKAPPSLKLLAIADATDWNAKSLAMGGSGEDSGYAAIGIFSAGGGKGTVFDAGVTDWVFGFKPELAGQAPTPLSTITMNVIRKLSGLWTESAEVRQFRSTPASGSPVYYYTVGAEVPAGMTLDGAAFVAWPAAEPGTVPVYRMSASTDGSVDKRFHYTIDPAALEALGWSREGVAYHAYAADGEGRRAVFQFRSQDAAGNLVTYFTVDDLNPPAGWVADGPAFFVPRA